MLSIWKNVTEMTHGKIQHLRVDDRKKSMVELGTAREVPDIKNLNPNSNNPFHGIVMK
jgi:hypothetical protein